MTHRVIRAEGGRTIVRLKSVRGLRLRLVQPPKCTDDEVVELLRSLLSAMGVLGSDADWADLGRARAELERERDALKSGQLELVEATRKLESDRVGMDVEIRRLTAELAAKTAELTAHDRVAAEQADVESGKLLAARVLATAAAKRRVRLQAAFVSAATTASSLDVLIQLVNQFAALGLASAPIEALEALLGAKSKQKVRRTKRRKKEK